MSRRTATIKIADDNRDQGKVYLLTEMPASRGEMWAARAFFAMAKEGIEVPEELRDSGMAGLATFGLNLIAKLPFEVAKPLIASTYFCAMK